MMRALIASFSFNMLAYATSTDDHGDDHGNDNGDDHADDHSSSHASISILSTHTMRCDTLDRGVVFMAVSTGRL